MCFGSLYAGNDFSMWMKKILNEKLNNYTQYTYKALVDKC
jgi:hypothetical protein